MSALPKIGEVARTLAEAIAWIVLLSTLGVLFVLTGYAARAGLQSLVMLALTTGLLAMRLRGDARALAWGAAGTIAASAAYAAFLAPPRWPYAMPLTWLTGAGTWLLVGIVLLARGRPGPGGVVDRRPDAWTWIVGAIVWLAISLTYANVALLRRLGPAAPYAWIPWATLGFVAGAVVLPRFARRAWPPVRAWLGALAWSTARGVAMGLAVGTCIGLLLVQVAGSGVAPSATLEGPALPCAACDPRDHVERLQVRNVTEGTLAIAQFTAAPDAIDVESASANVTLHLRWTAEGWSARRGDAGALAEGDVQLLVDGATAYVLLHGDAYRGAVAVHAPAGNRAPATGYASA